MTMMKRINPPMTGGLPMRSARGLSRVALRGALRSLLALLVFGLGTACGEQVVGWPDEDREPPYVVATTPVINATDVALNALVSATFNEPMDRETISDESFRVRMGAEAIEGEVTYVGGTAIWTPSVTLEADTLYTATVTDAVTDRAGNAMEEAYVWNFTTGTRTDRVRPQVSATDPPSGAVAVAPNSDISATFTETMNRQTINTSTFLVHEGVTRIDGEVTYVGVVATFRPEEPLEGNTEYSVRITDSAADLSGNTLAEDYVWLFTTGSRDDETAPRVVSTNPENGALDAPFNAPLTATFSEAMQASTLSATTFMLHEGTTPIPGSVSYTGVTATFVPTDPLEAFTTYTARISESVEDLAGNRMEEDHVWSFTTGLVPDTTPPFITGRAPSAGATQVPRNTRITATFSEAMEPLTITSASFVVFDGVNQVAGSVTYSGLIATFTPAEALDSVTDYTVTVLADVTDLAGNEMVDDESWSFRTGATSDTQHPRVTFTVPADDAANVPLNASVSAVFSEAMDPSTITSTSFTLNRLDTVITGAVTYNGVTATFYPSAPLDPLTTYSAAITTMATDLAGNALLEAYVWSFRTGVMVDSTPPIVLGTEPSDGATDVPRNSALTVVFSETMDAQSIDAESLTLEDDLGEPVEGMITVVGAIAVFAPLDPLDALTEYTGTVTVDVMDLAGNAIEEEYVWTFMTGDLVDTEAPFVLSSSPDDGEADVLRSAMVRATFSKSMNPLTINASTFELFGPGDARIQGSVSYDAIDAVATFRPDNFLLPATQYQAIIAVDAMDLAGNPLEQEHQWSFTTVDTLNAIPSVDLQSLSTFVAVAGAGLTNSNSGGTTVLNGDVGLSPTGTCLGDGSTCTDLNPVINGVLYANDLEGVAAQAKVDLVAAYVDAMARPPGTVVSDLAEMTLPPGVYTSESDISMAVGSTLTLDGQGDEDAVWIFQAGSSLTINNNAEVLTINGARAANVFWAVGSSSALGTEVSFQGNILAQEDNSVGTGSTVLGRLLCTSGAISLLSSTITLPPM